MRQRMESKFWNEMQSDLHLFVLEKDGCEKTEWVYINSRAKVLETHAEKRHQNDLTRSG